MLEAATRERGFAMEELLMRLVLLVVGFLGMLGPLVVIIGFLRHRERQESILQRVVHKELNSPDLRGLSAVNVHRGLFSQQGTVSIDFQDCSNEQILDTVMQLSARLPLQVQLVVNGITDFRSRSTLTLNVKRSFSSVPSISCCRS